MPERTTITQTVQIGVETTKGTAVPANKKLRSLSIEPRIQADVEFFRPMGDKYATLQAIGREWTEAEISGSPTYSEIVYVLSSLVRATTPSQVNPPAGTAYSWTFTPQQSAEDDVKTYTVEYGSSVRAAKFSYGLVREMRFTVTRERAELSGSMLGHRLVDNITMTSSPTDIELVPILPTHFDIYIDNTAASIGTTKMLRAVQAELTIGDRYGLVWPLDSAQASFAAHIEVEPAVTLSLVLEADSQGMGPLASLRNGEKRFIRVKATGPVIESTTNYLFQIDFCGIASEAPPFSDQDGLYAVTWTFRSVYDSAWGKPLEIKVINKQSAL